jgi:polysaccharide export outer membrane protein
MSTVMSNRARKTTARTTTARTMASATCTLAALALAAALAGAGCIHERPFVWISDVSGADDGRAAISPRDGIQVVVLNQPALSGEFVVHDDGGYLQPMLGNVHVDGRTPVEVCDELRARLKDLVVNPEVTVSITKVAPVRVSVIGEVKNPGSYELTRERGVIPALAAAGWLTEFAARDRIFVVRAGAIEQRIRFRAQDLTAAEPHAGRFRLKDGDVVVVE